MSCLVPEHRHTFRHNQNKTSLNFFGPSEVTRLVIIFLKDSVMEKKNEAKGIMILGGLVVALIIFKIFIYPYIEAGM